MGADEPTTAAAAEAFCCRFSHASKNCFPWARVLIVASFCRCTRVSYVLLVWSTCVRFSTGDRWNSYHVISSSARLSVLSSFLPKQHLLPRPRISDPSLLWSWVHYGHGGITRATPAELTAVETNEESMRPTAQNMNNKKTKTKTKQALLTSDRRSFIPHY